MVKAYKKLHWTDHSKIKMRQYGLSISKLLNILSRPERKEKGIAPGTTAVMRTNKKYGSRTMPLLKKDGGEVHPHTRSFNRNFGVGARKAPGEVWIMYKDVKIASVPMRKIISAWRYPGISKPGEEIPIPEDIKNEILNGILN